MCDNCKDEHEILRMLHLQNADLPDAIVKAGKRLRCYYECVTRDEDIFDSEGDSDDDDWDDEDL